MIVHARFKHWHDVILKQLHTRYRTGSTATEAVWTLAYGDTSAAQTAAQLIVSAGFTSGIAAEVGVELSAPAAEVVDEVEVVIIVTTTTSNTEDVLVGDQSQSQTTIPILSGGLRIRSPNAAIEVVIHL